MRILHISKCSFVDITLIYFHRLYTDRGISIYIVHLGQYACFTAVLHLVKVYVNISARNLFKRSPLVWRKDTHCIWPVDNEMKLRIWSAGLGAGSVTEPNSHYFSLCLFFTLILNSTTTSSAINYTAKFAFVHFLYIVHCQQLYA